MAASRPVWGAWIEIRLSLVSLLLLLGRAPYGARGLKLSYLDQIVQHLAVAPRMGRVD